MKMPFKPSTPSLEERIRETRAAADTFIEAEARKIASDNEGVPFEVALRLLRNRTFECSCACVLAILEQN